MLSCVLLHGSKLMLLCIKEGAIKLQTGISQGDQADLFITSVDAFDIT